MPATAADASGAGLRIACIGEAMIELSRLDLEAGTAALGVAGDALNAAIYLKRALPAAEVAFVTALGDDAFGPRRAHDGGRRALA